MEFEEEKRNLIKDFGVGENLEEEIEVKKGKKRTSSITIIIIIIRTRVILRKHS